MASKRKRMHVVTAPKSDNDKMHITIDKETLMNMDRAARRQAAIDNGMLMAGGVRGGVHGGNKRQRSKRARRDGRLQTRSCDNSGD